jgi:hypothetical protein
MINSLPDTINTFATKTKQTVGSLIRTVKADKQQVAELIKSVSNFSGGADYAPSVIRPLSSISSETFVDFFRDMQLRFERYYNASNAISVLTNSLSDIAISKISKLEKDIAYLENFIDNYEFISGKDDLYNYSYMENFNDLNGSSEANTSSVVPYVDRDGSLQNTTSFSGGFIDSINSKFKIGSSLNKINSIGLFKNIVIKTNYAEHVSSSTNPEKVFDDKQTKVWSVSVKAPKIITSLPVDIEKYVQYNYSYLLGAKTILELELNRIVEMDTVRLMPNYSDGLKLLQVSLEQSSNNAISNSTNPSSNFTLKNILDSPVDLSKPVDITFDKCKVKKIILVFNQDTYTRTENVSSEEELISRYMHEIVTSIRSERKRDHNTLQDLVISSFMRRLSIDENRRNNFLRSEYYTYKYPIMSSLKSSSSYSNIKKAKAEVEYAEVKNNSPLSRMAESIIGHVLGSRFNAIQTTLLRDGSDSTNSSGKISTMANPGFIPEFNTNIKDRFTTRDADPIIPGMNFARDGHSTSVKEKVNTYQYNFSIRSVQFFVTQQENIELQSENEIKKAIFISNKVLVPGKVLGIKAKMGYDTMSDSSVSFLDLKKKTSYELSISLKERPNQEIDWIPIIPYDAVEIDSEVLFFNTVTKTAKLRFHPKLSNFRLYEDGLVVAPSRYTLNQSTSSVLFSSFNQNSNYVASYSFDDISYSQKYIDAVAISPESGLTNLTENGSEGEYFLSTGLNNSIKISQNPYIDYGKFINPIYSPTFGTFNSDVNTKYNPVEVKLSDGSYAINLTNYIKGDFSKANFYETNEVLFYQNGKNIIFNKQINQPFNVIYSYINNNLRFRLIVRNNYPGSTSTASADNVILKMKINNSDNFSEKLLGLK